MTQIPHPPPRETSGKAIASLVVSIASLMSCPLVGIVGILLGHSALHDIRANPVGLTGDGLAKAGIIIGWIAVILAISVFCIWLAMVGVLVGASGA